MTNIAFIPLFALALGLFTGCSTPTHEAAKAAKADPAVARREEIRPINSWDDFRDLLKAEGKTEPEINAIVYDKPNRPFPR